MIILTEGPDAVRYDGETEKIPFKACGLPTIFSPEDGDSRPIFLRNFGICLEVHTTLQPRRTTLTSSPP
jgi:hypothetical protein